MLDGRTLDGPERAKNTTVTWLGSQDDATIPAVIEKLTGVQWHPLMLGVATLGACDIGKFNKISQWPLILACTGVRMCVC